MHNLEKPSGIGGWLILPMLGLLFTPLILGTNLIINHYPIFAEDYWSTLTTPGNEAYHALWGPLIIFEVIGNLVFLLFSIFLIILFFQKRRGFPLLMIWFLSSNLVFLLIDLLAAEQIPNIPSLIKQNALKELIKSSISALIWIPYFMKSIRVRNTFTN